MRRRLLFKLLNNRTVPWENLSQNRFFCLSPRPLLSATSSCHIAICCNLCSSFPNSLPLLCIQLTVSSLPPSPCLLASVPLLSLRAIWVIHCSGTNYLHAGIPPPLILILFFPSHLCFSPVFPQLSLSAPSWQLVTVTLLRLISHRMAAWQDGEQERSSKTRENDNTEEWNNRRKEAKVKVTDGEKNWGGKMTGALDAEQELDITSSCLLFFK